MTRLKHMKLWSQNIHKNRWKLMLGVSSLPWNNIHQKYFITTTTSHTGVKSLSLTSIKQSSSSSCISKICFTSSFFSLHLHYVDPDDGIEEQSDYNHWQPGTELYWPTAHVSRCQIFSHSLSVMQHLTHIVPDSMILQHILTMWCLSLWPFYWVWNQHLRALSLFHACNVGVVGWLLLICKLC